MSAAIKTMCEGCNLKVAEGKDNGRKYAGLVSFKAAKAKAEIEAAVKAGIISIETAADMLRSQNASKYTPLMAFNHDKDVNGREMPKRISVEITDMCRVFNGKVYLNLYQDDSFHVTKGGYTAALNVNEALAMIEEQGAWTVLSENKKVEVKTSVQTTTKTEAPAVPF